MRLYVITMNIKKLKHLRRSNLTNYVVMVVVVVTRVDT